MLLIQKSKPILIAHFIISVAQIQNKSPKKIPNTRTELQEHRFIPKFKHKSSIRTEFPEPKAELNRYKKPKSIQTIQEASFLISTKTNRSTNDSKQFMKP